MESLKIKVASTYEVEKVQDLLLKIGYFIGLESNINFSSIDDSLAFLYTKQCGSIHFGTKYGELNFHNLLAKEVTIKDLEDMAALADKNKEWLVKDTDGKYWLSKDEMSLVRMAKENIIEVPEGALMLTEDVGGYLTFWNGDSSRNIGDSHWYNPSDEIMNFNEYSKDDDIVILWQREKESIIDKLVDLPEFEHDAVNHPNHYTNGDIECIDAIEASMTKEAFCGYLKGNIQKYVWRYEKKGGIESIKKAEWYNSRLIKTLEK